MGFVICAVDSFLIAMAIKDRSRSTTCNRFELLFGLSGFADVHKRVYIVRSKVLHMHDNLHDFETTYRIFPMIDIFFSSLSK